MGRAPTSVRALVFDTRGTVVDWRSGILDELNELCERKSLDLDRERFIADWSAAYQPGKAKVNCGQWPWTQVSESYWRALHGLPRCANSQRASSIISIGPGGELVPGPTRSKGSRDKAAIRHFHALERRLRMAALKLCGETDRMHQVMHSLVLLVGGQTHEKPTTTQRRQFIEEIGVQARILRKPTCEQLFYG
jgi:hypothetical protein